MKFGKSLVLLVDGVPTPNGGGTSQTLANLLSGWKNDIYYLGGDTESQGGFEQRMDVKMLQYPKRKWERLSNRLGHWLNAWLLRRQLTHLQQLVLSAIDLPLPEQCIVLLSTSLPEKLIIGRRLQQAGYTVLPYFMDDWMAGSTLRWRGGNLQQTVQQLLQQAPAWLMISRQLHHTLLRRYQLAPKPCLVVHNPAPAVQLTDGSWQMASDVDDDNDAARKLQTANSILSKEELPTANRQHLKEELPTNNLNQAAAALAASHQEPAVATEDETPCQLPTANYQLIYAGSIWPMHADALAAVARAVHRLQQQGHVGFQLQVYSSAAHWQQQQAALAGPGVQYMGWLPYAQLQPLLQQAWLLVCTASFEEAHQAYSNSSVQTKLTDYMAAGRPILFVGPDEAASGQFVDEYDIGFSLATAHAADIAERLLAISALPVQYRRKCINALREASTRFSQAAVQQRLYAFLEEVGKG